MPAPHSRAGATGPPAAARRGPMACPPLRRDASWHYSLGLIKWFFAPLLIAQLAAAIVMWMFDWHAFQWVMPGICVLFAVVVLPHSLRQIEKSRQAVHE